MKRNKFSLSHYNLSTFNMGELIPLTWYEALPMDTIRQRTSVLVRVSPLLAPIMHPVKVRIHHFSVPIRLIWEDFEEFITGGPDGTSVPDHPYKNLNFDVPEGSLWNYLGIPVHDYTGANYHINMLPVRALNLIYNEFYRDQDLSPELTISTASGWDTTTTVGVQRVAWEKDYFTTARPWEQKGDTVTIPLGESAPITGFGVANQTFPIASATSYETDGTGSVTYTNAKVIDGAVNKQTVVEEDPNNAGFPNIRADLTQATGIDIADLRLALGIQKYQEARAMYGSRYVEYLKYIGVRNPSDARLQNPEYLGGGRNTIQFSEVLSTDGSNTGDMKGHGIAAMRTRNNQKFHEEHAICMTLMSVVPKAIYTQAINRKWWRETKEDYFQRELQHIGDQEITYKEAMADHSTPDDIFGYQARYDEYRSHPSNVSGEFQSTLDHWHMARQYASDIALNNAWVRATPTDRIYASTATDQLYVMANHSIAARRAISQRQISKI